MRSPTLLPMRMNAADTSASSAIADWTLLTVVSRSWTTAEIDTFMSDVSTTSTNIAIANNNARRRSLPACAPTLVGASVIESESLHSGPGTTCKTLGVRFRRGTRVLLACLIAVGAAACSSDDSDDGAATNTTSESTNPGPSEITPWPAPADAMAQARAAGLVPEDAERLEHHVHAHLDVFIDGDHVVVPAGIGINIDDPAVRDFTVDGAPAYGGINPPCDQPCISPLHTHDITGVLHTESATDVDNTLGQFFTEWDVKLDANCVATYCMPDTKIAVYVDGEAVHDDPRSITLSDHKEIAIVIGTPPAEVPSTGDFSQV